MPRSRGVGGGGLVAWAMADHFAYNFAYNHSAVTSHAAFPLSDLRRYNIVASGGGRGSTLSGHPTGLEVAAANCGQLRHSAARMGTSQYSRWTRLVQIALFSPGQKLSFLVQIAPPSTCTYLEVKGHVHINNIGIGKHLHQASVVFAY